MTDDAHDSPFMTGGGIDVLAEISRQRTDSMLGRVLGEYRITGLIAEGGMGRVYHAERVDGIFDRKVAIKLSPGGALSPDLKERFLSEQSILAGLNHPNISQLYDAGVTDDGLPYFVMDYVEGLPIDQYCDANDIGPQGRLALALDVARAVQFAHRNLIIHRDIKPSNVFVDESGRVRLLDFGIAKMLHPDAPSAHLTQESRRPATPAFASPEMLRGEPVDATTDVYSIGVLLYLLLTGRLPLEYDGLSLSETFSRATDTVPEPIGRFDPKLRGDLEAIVAKALAKLPEERYESVESLATDIRNYIEGLPVSARTPSAAYKARKFVARHRLSVAFSVFAVVALVTIAGLAIRSAIVSDRQAKQIALERDRAEQTKEFLIGVFESADPNIVPGEQTAREILEAGRARIEEDLAGQPEVQADLLLAMSSVYQNWRLVPEGLAVLQRELELREAVNGINSEEYARTLIGLAYISDIGGDYEASLDYARRALEVNTTVGNAIGQAAALERIGRIYHLQGQYDEARARFDRALALITAHAGSETLEVASIREHLANLDNHQGRFEAALAEFSKSLEIRKQYIPGDDSSISSIYLGMGNVLAKLDRLDEANDVFANGLAMNERLFGADNSYAMYFVNGLGKVAMARGDLEEAAARYEEARRLAERDMPGSPNLAFATANVAWVNVLQEKYESALTPLRAAQQLFEETLPMHWVLGEVKWQLGLCLAETGSLAEAEPLILAGIEIVENQWGPEHKSTGGARAAAVRLYEAWGKPAEADKYR
jgi:serine/threonine-protein kinase